MPQIPDGEVLRQINKQRPDVEWKCTVRGCTTHNVYTRVTPKCPVHKIAMKKA